MRGSLPGKLLLFLLAASLILFSLLFLPQLLAGPGETGSLGSDRQDLKGSLASQASSKDGEGSLETSASPTPKERIGVVSKTLLAGKVEGDGAFPLSLGKMLLLPAPPRFSGGLGGMIQSFSQGKGVENLAPNKNKGRALATAPLSRDGIFRFESPPLGRFSLVLDHPFYFFKEIHVVETRKDRLVEVGPYKAQLGGLVEVRAMDPQGLPLKGLRLRMQSRPDFTRMMDPAKAGDPANWVKAFLPFEGKTDEQGRAFFWGVAPGKYLLHGRRKAFASQSRELLVRRGTRQIVRLSLSRGVVLDLRVTGPDKKPVPGAMVRVELPQGAEIWGMGFGGARMRKEAVSGRTDARGQVHFDTLRRGYVNIQLRAPGFVQLQRKVELVAAKTTTVVELDRGLSMEGIVTDAQGTPLGGAGVAPLGEAGQEFMGFSGASLLPRQAFEKLAQRAGVKTDEKGRFQLWGFAKGQKTKLFALKEGFSVQTTRELTAGTKGIRISCPRQALLRGRVVDHASGDPVPSFTVRVERSAFMMFQSRLGELRKKDSDGFFELGGLSPGAAQISIMAPEKNTVVISKTLVEGENPLGEIRMRPPLVVEGRVVDRRGHGLAGVDVWVSRGRMADNPEMHAMMGIRKVRTGEQGRFRLVGVPEGRFRLGAFRRGWSPNRSKVLRVPSETGLLKDVVLEMNRGGVIEGVILSAEGIPLAGAWVQAKTTDQSFSQSALSDADGGFRFEGLADGSYALVGMKKGFMERASREAMEAGGAGSKSILKRISSMMKRMARAQVRVREGETSKVELKIPASQGGKTQPDLWGEVRLGGKGLSQGLVSLTPVGAGALPLMGSVQEGRFRVENVPDGSYRIRFQKGFGRGPVGEERELILKGPRSALRFDFPASMLAGRVLRPDGSPADAGLMVRLWKQGGRSETIDDPNPWLNGNATLTSGKGNFRFQGIAPGTYDLKVRSLGFLSKDSGGGELKGIVLGEGERRTDLVVRLSRGGEFEVQVLAEGKPLPRAVVRLLDPKGKLRDLLQVQITDAEGKALFERVSEGDWKVLARAKGWAPKLSPLQRLREGSVLRVRLDLERGIPVDLSLSSDLHWKGLVVFSVWKTDGAFVLQGAVPSPATQAVVGNLEPGTYRLRVENSVLGRMEQEVHVPPRGSAHWVLKK